MELSIFPLARLLSIGLKIPKGQSQTVIRRKTDDAMAKSFKISKSKRVN